jgi:hypothetical protein
MAEILCPSQQSLRAETDFAQARLCHKWLSLDVVPRKREQAMFCRVSANIRLGSAIFRPIRAGIFI